MYCPLCGQQQVSDLTRFCSRCGFLLTGVAQVIANNGNVPQIIPDPIQNASSMRVRGIKFGGALMLSGVILTPISAILLNDTRLGEYVIPLVAILTFLGGLLTMLFSAIFLSGVPKYALSSDVVTVNKLENSHSLFQGSRGFNALPPQAVNFNPVNSESYKPPAAQPVSTQGNWRESNTNELVMPPSVTEDTTKLLNQPEPK